MRLSAEAVKLPQEDPGPDVEDEGSREVNENG
jgi:hypothetical protein